MDIEDSRIRFANGRPIGYVGEYAIISDIHFGFERTLKESGYDVKDMTQNIIDSVKSVNRRKLVILGDVRDKFGEIKPDEGGALLSAFSSMTGNFDEIVITKGNHDAGLYKLINRFNNVRLLDEFIIDKVGFLHGHKLPSLSLASSVDTLCMGHVHPSTVVEDSNGIRYKKDCWLLCDLALPASKYKEPTLKYLIVAPKFNPFIGSTDKFRKTGILRYVKNVNRVTTDLLFLLKA